MNNNYNTIYIVMYTNVITTNKNKDPKENIPNSKKFMGSITTLMYSYTIFQLTF